MATSQKPAAKKAGAAKGSAKRPVGRPSSYTDAIADTICERIAEGFPLHLMCKEPGYPHAVTVYRWLDTHEEFRNKYAHARDRAADMFAAEVISIADNADETIRSVEKARLRIDARKWAAGKFAPKKYSERLQAEITGKDGGPILTKKAHELTDDELAAIVAAGSAGNPDPSPGAR